MAVENTNVLLPNPDGSNPLGQKSQMEFECVDNQCPHISECKRTCKTRRDHCTILKLRRRDLEASGGGGEEGGERGGGGLK